MGESRQDTEPARAGAKSKDVFFWLGDESIFWAIKEGGKVALAISSRGDPHRHEELILTTDEFSSLVCDLVKYLLNLPIVAREIPASVTCADVPHGLLGPTIEVPAEGDVVPIPLDERWLRYHGLNEGGEIVVEVTDKGVFLRPASPTKAQAREERSGEAGRYE